MRSATCRGAPGTFWLSGEQKDQVVLAATGGQLASLALPAESDGAALDIADTGAMVVFQNRTTGKATTVDGIRGTLAESFDAAPPIGERSQLVTAGNDIYLVEPAFASVRRLSPSSDTADPNPEEGEPIVVGPFDQWVGTNDGRLWLLDSPSGDLTSVDGDQPNTIDFAEDNQDLTLSAVGADPVVLDRTGGRVRWPRLADSYPIPDFTGVARVQEPMSSGTCVVVVVPSAAWCLSSDGSTKRLPFSGDLVQPDGAQVFANGDNVLIAWGDSTELLLGSWPDASWSTARRTDGPSGRPMVGYWTPGGLLVNDPGAAHALTADRGVLVELDKFDSRTVVLSSDGIPTGEGLVVGDTDGVEGDVLAESDEPLETAAANNAINDAPQPQADDVVTRVGRRTKIDVLANDIDPDLDQLAIVSVSEVDGEGTAVIVDSSYVLFTPTGTQPSRATFDYEVTDPDGRTGTAPVRVQIVGPDANTDPIAVDDSAKTVSGVGVSIDVLTNDSDNEGDPLVITRVTTPENGSTTVEDGQIKYTSAPDFVGTDTFLYDVNDGYGGDATAQVTVLVVEPSADNQPPEPQPDRTTVVVGNSVQITPLINDIDPDGDPLQIPLVEPPPEGSGLTATVLPNQDVSISAAAEAPAGLVQLTYQVSDGITDPVRETIAVIVTAASTSNRSPLAVDDSEVVTSASAKLLYLTRNDSDPDGDPLTIVGVSDVSEPSIGSVRITSASTVEFRPSGQTGKVNFTYTVGDPGGRSDTATVTVQVVNPTNSGPIARDDSVTVSSAAPVTIRVLDNDSHPDGLPIVLNGTPTYSTGRVVVNADQSVTFTPPSAEARTYTFSYSIRDSFSRTATAQITVIVVDRSTINQAPVAVNDQVTTPFNTSVTIPVLNNDVEPDGQTLDIAALTQPAIGTANIVGKQIRFTPTGTQSGLATFTYTIADPDGATSTASVVVQVLAEEKVPPIARDDLAALTTGDPAATIDVLANDNDPDGPNTALTVQVLSVTPSGLVHNVTPTNRIRVVPPNSAGTYTIMYTITDADLLVSAPAKLTVQVSKPPNTAPTAAPDSATTLNQAPVVIAVLANDTDPEGGQLTLNSVGPATADDGSTVGSTEKVGNSVRFAAGALRRRHRRLHLRRLRRRRSDGDRQGAGVGAAVRP